LKIRRIDDAEGGTCWSYEVSAAPQTRGQADEQHRVPKIAEPQRRRSPAAPTNGCDANSNSNYFIIIIIIYLLIIFKKQKKTEMRENVVREILTTERNYKACLFALINEYQQPLKDAIAQNPNVTTPSLFPFVFFFFFLSFFFLTENYLAKYFDIC
jgi:hypothetical protein